MPFARSEFEFYCFDGAEPNEFFHTCDAFVMRSKSRASLHQLIWLILYRVQYLYITRYLSLLTHFGVSVPGAVDPHTQTNALLFPDYGILRVDCVLRSFWLFLCGFGCIDVCCVREGASSVMIVNSVRINWLIKIVPNQFVHMRSLIIININFNWGKNAEKTQILWSNFNATLKLYATNDIRWANFTLFRFNFCVFRQSFVTITYQSVSCLFFFPAKTFPIKIKIIRSFNRPVGSCMICEIKSTIRTSSSSSLSSWRRKNMKWRRGATN